MRRFPFLFLVDVVKSSMYMQKWYVNGGSGMRFLLSLLDASLKTLKPLNHVGEVKLSWVDGGFLGHFEVHRTDPKVDT